MASGRLVPRARVPVLSLASVLLAGCGLLGGGTGPGADEAVLPGAYEEGEALVEHLTFLEAYATADPEQQAGILEAARESASAIPTAENRLRHALLLAYPSSSSQDPAAALAEIEALLASGNTLRPSERTLLQLLHDDLSARAHLRRENDEIAARAARSGQEREQALNRRVQAQAAEIDRLRQALEEAEAKLKAVAELEKSLAERQAVPKAPPP